MTAILIGFAMFAGALALAPVLYYSWEALRVVGAWALEQFTAPPEIEPGKGDIDTETDYDDEPAGLTNLQAEDYTP